MGRGGDGKTDTLLTGSFLVLGSSLCLDLRILCTYIIKRLRLNKAFAFSLPLTASKPYEPAHIPWVAYSYICISGSGFTFFPRSFFNIDFPDNSVSSLSFLVLSICSVNWDFALF